ncbi:MAG: ABC transporter permease [Anaerolineales bacterium]
MRAFISLTLAVLLNLSRYRSEYLGSFLGPVFWVIPAWLIVRYANMPDVFGADGSNFTIAAMYFFIGATYWNYVEGIWSIALGLRENMRLGTLESLWASPASRFSMIMGWSVGRLLGTTLHSLLAFGLLSALSVIHLRDFSPENILAAVVVIIFSVLAAYGFGFVLVGLTLKFKDAESMISMLGNAAPLLGGILFPITYLPAPLRLIAYAFPFTYGVDTLRGVLFGSKTLLPLPTEIGLIITMGLLFPIFGWIFFSWIESKARNEGIGTF